MMLVVLIATISSCGNNDNDKDDVINPAYLMRTWDASKSEDKRIFEFKQDGTYFFETSTGRTEGNYRITESKNTKFVYFGDEYDATLFKMLVTGSSDFDQLWIYYAIYTTTGQLAIDFYLSNELVDKCTFLYTIVGYPK